MEDKKKNIRHVLNIIVILFITMLLVSGGTFAYLRWISSTDQQTNLAIQIEENINMHIENPLLTKAGMYPTNTCTNEAATMSGVSIIALENQTGVIARPKFKLRVKITDKDGNVITNNSAGSANSDNPYRYFINYAVAEENGTCTEPLYSGNFDQNEPTYQGQTQWYDSEWITLMNDSTGFPLISNGQDSGVSFNGTPYQTTYHNYKVWVWIDESYVSVNTGDVVSDKLQDAKIELSWSENSTVQQIKAQAYAVFSSSAEGGDDSLRFYQSDEPITEDLTYAGRPVTNVYTGFETTEYSNDSTIPWTGVRSLVKTVVVEDTITPISTANWFTKLSNCAYFDVTKLNTSNVINMIDMFSYAGGNGSVFTIEGMENWDTANVTNMAGMFAYTAQLPNVTTFNISDISGWNVSNVKWMSSMFSGAGANATNEWSLDLSNWDVYKVTNYTNFESSNNIIPPNWYTSYAVYSEDDNSLRFYRTQTDLTQESEWNGRSIDKIYNVNLLSIRDETEVPWADDDIMNDVTSIVVENEIYPNQTIWLFYGFSNCSYYDLRKLNTDKVTDMSYMFAYSSTKVSTLTFLTNFNDMDTSNVTYMEGMFDGFATNTTNNWSLDLSKWNTSNVTNMNYMFRDTGKNATYFNIGDISRWDVSSVEYMSNMFKNTGTNSTTFYLDLSNWNVQNVIQYDNFNTNVEDKVKAPNFN